MKIVNTIEIQAPPVKVFSWIENPERAKEWMTSVTRSEIIQEMPNKVGTTFLETVEEDGRSVEMQGIVIDFKPNQRFSIKLESDYHTAEVDFTLEETEGITYLTQNVDLQFKGAAVLRTLERQALAQLQRAEDLATAAGPQDDQRVDAWLAAELKAETMIELAAEFRFWYGCVCDSLELVDWRSGEIRDRAINQWLLDECLSALADLDHPKIRSWLTYIKNQSDQLFTFLDWLEVGLDGWQQTAASQLSPVDVPFLARLTAKAWRLQRAVINGHHNFASAARQALAMLEAIIADDLALLALAQQLLTILEQTIRTSCAAETVNSIIKAYLHTKRSFQSRETAQNWFNLFRLWFCMHPFKRSPKRQGQSPFQLAGIKVYTPTGELTNDWMAALGYPADA